ncbi:glycosyl hydrolase [Halobacteriales archaeon QS_5_68_33]|nr:MAG: glycosyl hydrolase [Halobacteriales archaeon QS_5_68_33]
MDGQSTEPRVEELLEEMTVAEKVGQMVGVPPSGDLAAVREAVVDHHVGSVHFGGTPHNTPGEQARFANAVQKAALEETRLGVPLFQRAMAEHGAAAIAGSTVFPQQLGMAATRDPDLVAEGARVTAEELRAVGIQSTSSPIGDVARDQRWGRIEETFGESPRLCARLAAAMVEGYQGEDLSAADSVLAVAKHFPMYSEGVRGEDAAPNDHAEYTLRRVHVPPYEAAIEAGTGGIMPCYNAINGEPVHGSRTYLGDLLRRDLGFEGFVLADYTGAEDLHRGHRVTDSLEESLWQAITAGIDLLPSGGIEYAETVLSLVESGKLSEARVEESARRVLRAKVELGLFADPYVDEERAERLGNDANREVARDLARESMTLLQNEGDLLPLSGVEELVVAGPNADALAHQHGGWGHVGDDPEPLGETVLEGIEAVADDATTVTHEPGCTVTERRDLGAARDAAAEADAAVVVLGEPDYVHEFSRSTVDGDAETFPTRVSLELPEAQRELTAEIHATGTPTVAVFVTGRVLATPWVAEHVPAIVLAYRPGSEGGHAVAETLFGENNPSGALPISIPKSEGHLPTRFNHLPHPRRHGAPGSHAPSYDPLFEYGHGLSYTEFEYEGISLSETRAGPGEVIDVAVEVSNVGDRAGSEPVELFVRDERSSRVTPVRELAGVTRIDLDAGESGTARFELPVEAVGVMGDDGRRTVEPGRFTVTVAGLEATFEVERAYE